MNSKSWKHGQQCKKGLIKQYFNKVDIKSLETAQKTCKKGCDEDAKCKFATLQFAPPPEAQACELFGMDCKGHIDDVKGAHLYEKGTDRKIEGMHCWKCHIHFDVKIDFNRLLQILLFKMFFQIQDPTRLREKFG